MPQWIHDRARHIQAKNPEMPESQAFAIATQQSHSLGKSPKGYGTEEGRKKAKAKFDTPKDDKKTADPGGIGKEAVFGRILAPLLTDANDERMRLIVQEELSKKSPPHQKHKTANLMASPFSPALIRGFADEIMKIANLSGTDGKPTVASDIKSTMPRNTLTSPAKYSKIHTDSSPSPVSKLQPVLSPPPVQG